MDFANLFLIYLPIHAFQTQKIYKALTVDTPTTEKGGLSCQS